jgi:hypothetical protein
LVNVRAAFGPGAAEATLSGGRLYRLDDDGTIQVEQVVIVAIPD